MACLLLLQPLFFGVHSTYCGDMRQVRYLQTTDVSPVLQTGAILIPFFQQFTGINTIMFYATELFDVLGDGANSALLDTAIVGAVNVGSTILAIVLVDRSATKLCLTNCCVCCVH